MSITDRKARAWRWREGLILDTADAMLREHGYLGLNLDDLAGRIEYSKATIYNHFPSKEDLLLAVCLRQARLRADLFSRALTFAGRSRERMFVIGLADRVLAETHPHAFGLMQLIQTPSIWEKTAPENRMAFGKQFEKAMGSAMEIIRQARVEQDLAPSAPPDHQILFGLVTMSKGAHLLGADPLGLCGLLGSDAPNHLDILTANYHAFLDGVGWQPLSTAWDYAATAQRIYNDIFRDQPEAPIRRS